MLKNKFLIITILLFLLYITHVKPYVVEYIHVPVVPDIVISPGGRYGMYNLGICHYVKQTFDIKNKHIVGFSAGAWNALFMCMDKDLMDDFVRKSFNIFEMEKEPISNMLKKTIKVIEQYDIKQFDVEHLHVGTSQINKTTIFNKFLTIDDIIRACIASSFIPFLTYNDLFYFYKNISSIDGGLYYSKYIKKLPSTTLRIHYKMFGRHTDKNIFKDIVDKSSPPPYQLYIKGYHDAIKHHDYFAKYFV